jgi:hypothetical protein
MGVSNAERTAPPEGLAAYIEEQRAQGLTQRELNRITKENPARLLGLPAL